MTGSAALLVGALAVLGICITQGTAIFLSFRNGAKIDAAQKTITEIHVMTNSRLDEMTKKVEQGAADRARDSLAIAEDAAHIQRLEEALIAAKVLAGPPARRATDGVPARDSAAAAALAVATVADAAATAAAAVVSTAAVTAATLAQGTHVPPE